MWSRIPVGRPMVLDRRQWFNVADPRLRPTFAYLWDQVTVNYARVARAYDVWQQARHADTLDG